MDESSTMFVLEGFEPVRGKAGLDKKALHTAGLKQ
jgi:hypothetical protein